MGFFCPWRFFFLLLLVINNKFQLKKRDAFKYLFLIFFHICRYRILMEFQAFASFASSAIDGDCIYSSAFNEMQIFYILTMKWVLFYYIRRS